MGIIKFNNIKLSQHRYKYKIQNNNFKAQREHMKSQFSSP